MFFTHKTSVAIVLLLFNLQGLRNKCLTISCWLTARGHRDPRTNIQLVYLGKGISIKWNKSAILPLRDRLFKPSRRLVGHLFILKYVRL